MQLTDAIFYKDGVSGVSHVAGFESGVTRVVRYSFTTPETGATSLSFRLDDVSKGSGADIPLRFAITADPDSHTAAGASAPYTGETTIRLASYTVEGTAQVRLMPNTAYYLWVFPGQDVWGWYYMPATGQVTLSGTTQGVVTASGGLLGQPLDITVYGEGTYRLTWRFGNASGTIGSGITGSITWTPPLTLASAIPNSQSGLCTITCCPDGETEGQTTTITLSVPDSLAPQVAVTLTDPTGAANLGVYLEDVTTLELGVSTGVYYGATVTSTVITLDSVPYSGENLEAGEHTVAVIVTDSRGLIGVWQRTIQVESYTVPQLELKASRCRSDGTPDDTGDHAKVTIRGFVSMLEGNTAALTLHYGTTQELPSGVGNFETIAVIPADPNETLRIQARLADAVKTVTRSMVLSTGYPTMEFFAGGKGISMGKVAESEGFHCGMDAYFSGKVLDGQGRTLAGRYDLTAVTGMYLTPIYGRVLELMGTGFLQLKFTCNRSRSAGDQLFSGELPIEEELTVTDQTGNHSLILSPTGVTANSPLPTGTYTFSTLLY